MNKDKGNILLISNWSTQILSEISLEQVYHNWCWIPGPCRFYDTHLIIYEIGEIKWAKVGSYRKHNWTTDKPINEQINYTNLLLKTTPDSWLRDNKVNKTRYLFSWNGLSTITSSHFSFKDDLGP